MFDPLLFGLGRGGFILYIFRLGEEGRNCTATAQPVCPCRQEGFHHFSGCRLYTSFKTGSTKKEIKVEVCSQCHPFYTGSKRLLVEQGGRVDKFRKKYGL